MIFTELLERLEKWNKLSLKEFLAILAVKFGDEIYDNRDLYSFLVHLAEKESYVMKDTLEKQLTVLEKMVVENLTDDIRERYKDISFNIEYDGEEITLRGEDETARTVTNMIFIRV